MFKIITQTVTFTNGTAQIIGAMANYVGVYDRAARVFIQPDAANSHVMYVGDQNMALGSSTVDHVIDILDKPETGQSLDEMNLGVEYGVNCVPLAQLSVDGTTNEKCRITVFIG